MRKHVRTFNSILFLRFLVTDAQLALVVYHFVYNKTLLTPNYTCITKLHLVKSSNLVASELNQLH